MRDHVPHKTLKDAKASWAVWRGSCVTRGVCTIPAALEKQKSKRPAVQCSPVPKPTPPPAAPGPAAASRAGVTPQPGCSVKHGAVPSLGAEEPLQGPPCTERPRQRRPEEPAQTARLRRSSLRGPARTGIPRLSVHRLSAPPRPPSPALPAAWPGYAVAVPGLCSPSGAGLWRAPPSPKAWPASSPRPARLSTARPRGAPAALRRAGRSAAAALYGPAGGACAGRAPRVTHTSVPHRAQRDGGRWAGEGRWRRCRNQKIFPSWEAPTKIIEPSSCAQHTPRITPCASERFFSSGLVLGSLPCGACSSGQPPSG